MTGMETHTWPRKIHPPQYMLGFGFGFGFGFGLVLELALEIQLAIG